MVIGEADRVVMVTRREIRSWRLDGSQYGLDHSFDSEILDVAIDAGRGRGFVLLQRNGRARTSFRFGEQPRDLPGRIDFADRAPEPRVQSRLQPGVKALCNWASVITEIL